jgi:uncharacterized protein (DUF305 family)
MTFISRSFIRKRAISLAATTSVAVTSFALAQNPTNGHQRRVAIPVQYVTDRPDYSEEQPYLSANDAAMNRMMSDMTIKPTGNVDRDFIAMMVPHHEGAIEMAKTELIYGRNAQLRRLAEKIVRDQQQEIAVMRLADEDKTSAPHSVHPGTDPASAMRSGMKNDSIAVPGVSHVSGPARG